MGLYEGIKDIANVVLKADNIDLYRHLIELSAQALELQNEINRLNNENMELKKTRDLENRIERCEESYITLKNDAPKILYCSHCWDSERKLIQLKCNSGKYVCIHCSNEGIYDKRMNEAEIERRRAEIKRASNRKNFF